MVQFFRFVKYIIKNEYGYCKKRDGNSFMSGWRCVSCDASDVQDWIDMHIKLIR